MSGRVAPVGCTRPGGVREHKRSCISDLSAPTNRRVPWVETARGETPVRGAIDPERAPDD